jgi:cephalosporin hydroxylase
MKLTVDTDLGIVCGDGFEYGIGTPEAFKMLSDLWIRSGWDTKYVYSFAWFGRPMIQLPEDMMRIQEVIYNVQPDVLIETGVAHGGSLIFYAGLFKAMEKGRVVGVDIEIRPYNRVAIESHFLSNYITLIERSSTANETISDIAALVKKDETVMVVLDSNHSYDHVLEELRLYSQFVSIGSYIVATDGVMEYVVGAPRTSPDWITNNPKKAAEDFVRENSNFVIEEPAFPFNEGLITERVTYWPSAYIKRIR